MTGLSVTESKGMTAYPKGMTAHPDGLTGHPKGATGYLKQAEVEVQLATDIQWHVCRYWAQATV